MWKNILYILLISRVFCLECGLAPKDIYSQKSGNRTTRIIRGNAAKLGYFPWQVSIRTTKGSLFGCGGTLISEKWVLTAAHCFSEKGHVHSYIEHNTEELYLVAGQINQTDLVSSTVQICHALQYIKHDRYNENGFQNFDIAVVELARPALLTDFVYPACLGWNEGNILAEVESKTQETNKLYVSGWGLVNYATGDVPNILQFTDVRMINRNQCHKWLLQRLSNEYDIHLPESANDTYALVNDHAFCAGWVDGRSDSCVGDSGGPLAWKNSETGLWEVIGVVSWGIGCGVAESPGVYTHVKYFINWIYDHTGLGPDGFVHDPNDGHHHHDNELLPIPTEPPVSWQKSLTNAEGLIRIGNTAFNGKNHRFDSNYCLSIRARKDFKVEKARVFVELCDLSNPYQRWYFLNGIIYHVPTPGFGDERGTLCVSGKFGKPKFLGIRDCAVNDKKAAFRYETGHLYPTWTTMSKIVAINLKHKTVRLQNSRKIYNLGVSFIIN